jgi:uncharacterized protein YodC (DUF2158 family)
MISEEREPRFKPGDVVQLRSGGPLMTVMSVGSEGDCRCVWFTEEALSPGFSFSEAALIGRHRPSAEGAEAPMLTAQD